jgi:hypothetical protein
MQEIDPQVQSFNLQMEFLKLELQSINETLSTGQKLIFENA